MLVIISVYHQPKILFMAGLYIHIPFCSSRCIYCGFYSTTLLSLRGEYINAICKEFDLRRDYIHEQIDTIYIGGGTPSQLKEEELHRLFDTIYNNKVYDISPNAEITMECNPDDITTDMADTISQLPINRISMGVQTFNNSRLKFIRRRHTAEQIGNAISMLRHADISNISIDLMFGFPDETINEWNDDVSHALALDVQHISAYSLTYEEGTSLHNMLAKGIVSETDEELSRTMYYNLSERLIAAGYEHYEISNFALPGFRSRHNGNYWKGIPYIGIGAAAHSFDTVSRQWNIAVISKYIESINNGIIPMESEELDTDTCYNDTVMTALRTCEGIDLQKLEMTFGKPYTDYLLTNGEKHISSGNLCLSQSHLSLTRNGLFVSDGIMSDLMKV